MEHNYNQQNVVLCICLVDYQRLTMNLRALKSIRLEGVKSTRTRLYDWDTCMMLLRFCEQLRHAAGGKAHLLQASAHRAGRVQVPKAQDLQQHGHQLRWSGHFSGWGTGAAGGS